MIHNLIILRGGVGVLFHKAWYEDCLVAQKINTLSGVITVMKKMSKEVVGSLPSYIHFGEISLTLAFSPASKLICALFHDSEDGQEFGKLMASQLLHSFLDEYDGVDFSRTIQDTSRFQTFTNKLHDAIRNSVVPVLSYLSSHRGHIQSVIVYTDGKTHTNLGAGQIIEMAANVIALITTSTSLLTEKQQSIYLQTENRNVLIFRLSNGGSLVCVCKKLLGEKVLSVSDYMGQCLNAVALLEKVFQIAHNLHT